MEQMQRIFEDFGAQEYTTNRLRMIWDACKDLPDRNFQAICVHFSQTRPVKYPPLPTHFIEEAQRQRKSLLPVSFEIPRNSETDAEPAGQSLARVLSHMGVTSLEDAVMKRRLKSGSSEK